MPPTESEAIALARRAITKADNFGQRGLERITYPEIEAMVICLVCLGLTPIPPEGDQK